MGNHSSDSVAVDDTGVGGGTAVAAGSLFGDHVGSVSVVADCALAPPADSALTVGADEGGAGGDCAPLAEVVADDVCFVDVDLAAGCSLVLDVFAAVHSDADPVVVPVDVDEVVLSLHLSDCGPAVVLSDCGPAVVLVHLVGTTVYWCESLASDGEEAA